MPVKIEIADMIENATKIDVVQWLKNEGDIVAEDDALVIVSISETDAIQVNAGQEGILFKILIPEGSTDLTGKETLGLIAIIGDQKEDISKSIMLAEHFNIHLNNSVLDQIATEGSDDDVEAISARDYRKLITAQPGLIESNAVRSLACLIGTGFIAWAGFALARNPLNSADPNPLITLVTIGICLSLMGAAIYLLAKLPDQYGEGTDSLLPGAISCVGTLFALIVALFTHQGNILVSVLAFVVAGGALLYAGYQNIKCFRTRDGVLATLVELLLIPLVAVVTVAVFFLRHYYRSHMGSALQRSQGSSQSVRSALQGSSAGRSTSMIGNVIQRGSFLQIYDENNRPTGSISLRPDDELRGYTSRTINVKQGSFINTYNEKGQRVGTASIR